MNPLRFSWIFFYWHCHHINSPCTSLSNKQCKLILASYMKSKYMTQNVLQNAKTLTKISVFGDPNVNVQYMTALCTELEDQGHSFKVMEKVHVSLNKFLNALLSRRKQERQKNKGIKMTASAKMDFLKAWSVKHAEMLDLGGLGDVPDGALHPSSVVHYSFHPTLFTSHCHICNRPFKQMLVTWALVNTSCTSSTVRQPIATPSHLLWDHVWQRQRD